MVNLLWFLGLLSCHSWCLLLACSLTLLFSNHPQHGLFMDMVDVCIIAGANGVEVKERK